MNVYAFDVDDCLEVSKGPVTLAMLMALRVEGHIVGLCGNWGVVTSRVPGWQHLISFFNVNIPKHEYLHHLKNYIKADDYVMVGNIGPECTRNFNYPQTGGSNDMTAAHLAGWRFIKEQDFANGNR